MIANLARDPVIRRRLFTIIMVAGALMLGVTLALLVANIRTVQPVPAQASQSSGSAVAVTPPATQAVVPSASAPAAPPATAAPQPAAIRLRLADFTTACQEQYADTATAKIARNTSEPPSYWVKCFVQGANVGGISLDDYCRTVEPGTRSDNPKRFDYKVEDHPWLSWVCVPA
jgi:hypothetical protein